MRESHSFLCFSPSYGGLCDSIIGLSPSKESVTSDVSFAGHCVAYDSNSFHLLIHKDASTPWSSEPVAPMKSKAQACSLHLKCTARRMDLSLLEISLKIPKMLPHRILLQKLLSRAAICPEWL